MLDEQKHVCLYVCMHTHMHMLYTYKHQCTLAYHDTHLIHAYTMVCAYICRRRADAYTHTSEYYNPGMKHGYMHIQFQMKKSIVYFLHTKHMLCVFTRNIGKTKIMLWDCCVMKTHVVCFHT